MTIFTIRRVLLLALLAVSIPVRQAVAGEPLGLWHSEVLNFAGYEWQAKTGYYYPGKNDWEPRNAWVDDHGWLHLAITDASGWRCAEIASRNDFGYGLYRFYVIGRLDRLDVNAVLGLFLYGQAERNGVREMDIEFARWGHKEAPAGNFSVLPTTQAFPITLSGEYTTHQLLWLPDRVEFASFHGHGELSDSTQIARWQYVGNDRPQTPLRLHMNYWLFGGRAPMNGLQSEIIIRNFIYQPWP